MDPSLVEIGVHISTPGVFRLLGHATAQHLMTYLQHLGGIHSGCSSAGVAWLIFKVVTVWRHRDIEPMSILVVGILTNVAVFLTALAAFPWVRNTHHK